MLITLGISRDKALQQGECVLRRQHKQVDVEINFLVHLLDIQVWVITKHISPRLVNNEKHYYFMTRTWYKAISHNQKHPSSEQCRYIGGFS